MPNKPQLSWTKPLLWDEGLRAVMCMLPMVLGMLMGWTGVISALGQGGFYFSSLPLHEKRGMRLIMGGILLTIGLGLYLIGGNVVFNPWIAVIFTFLIGVNLVFLSNWKLLGPLVFSMISIYAAGLNASSPEKVHSTFMAFVLALGWATLVSLLPIFKGTPMPATPPKEVPDSVLAETGLRMGIGVALAEFLSQLFGFPKMGWATSAAGNVIRFDNSTSKLRARLRMIGTVGGVILMMVSLRVTDNLLILSILTLVYAFLNGLTKGTKLGQTVILYTATILTLYALNDLSSARELSWERILLNLVGVAIGVWVALYPFPRLFSKVKAMRASTGEDVQS